jgi:phenylalanyl-tRNA synthetase beta chain
MRVPLTWLQEFVSPPLSLHDLEQRLTMTGTKVEALHHHGVSEEDAFVVGKVVSSERHPDADRLSVCMVDVGDGGEAKQIVCGAPNVAAGQTVAVARPGAVMPDGTKLKAAKLRGVTSDGMILAEDELAIGTGHDGIMILDDALPAGTPLSEVLPIATDVLELEITPNRPDCLSVYGVAREVHAATGAPLAPPPWRSDPGSEGAPAGIEVELRAPELCPRFTGRVFENVTIGPSPPWLKGRLMAAGQRPINNVVDITNYAMLLTGQPLHAFDLDRVEGGRLVVRRAGEGEQMETLDGQTRTLDAEMLVIDDAGGPTSIAGVMGGARSEVHDGTTRVFMEVATWIGPNINRTSAKLGLRSEASARFEKQLAPESAMEALIVATQLMLELAGATLAPGTLDVGDWHDKPLHRVIRLRDQRTARLLGYAVPRLRAAEILDGLGFGVTEAEDGLDVRVPHFRRYDVTREADLVEEVARIDGLEKLPATLPSRRGAVGVLSAVQRARRRAEDALVGCGLSESVGWTFASPDTNERLGLDIDPIAPINPMTNEQAVMRATLLGSLLDVARHNVRRGQPGVRLFEAGAVFRPWREGVAPAPWAWAPPEGSKGALALAERRLPDERQHLGALLTGALRPVSWREPHPPQADFFAAKGVLAALMRALRVEWSAEPGSEPFLHPARGARVLVAGAPVGWLGELHPRVAGRWDLERVAGFELDLALVLAAADTAPEFHDLVSFPAVRQDIAVVVGEEVPADAVLAEVRNAAGPTLRAVEVFDVYRGDQVGEGKASLALHLVFQADDRTLTDDEVDARRKKIVTALKNRLGAELRG